MPALAAFRDKLTQLQQLNTLVASHIDPAMAANCQVANLRDGCLILTTTSPVWHHKLRFASSDLLSALRAHRQWAGLKSIEIRVDYLPNQQ